MKKRILYSINFLLLAVYLLFSSGIGFSIHHCCTHCITSFTEIAEESSCACGHDHDEMEENANHHACAKPIKEEHQHHQDTYHFFKIVDEYNKIEPDLKVLYQEWIMILPNVVDEKVLGTLCEIMPQKTPDLPYHLAISCHSFIDFSHQRIYYA